GLIKVFTGIDPFDPSARLPFSLPIELQATCDGPDVEYTFKHALTLGGRLQSVLVERRRLLHERAAQAIEALFSNRLEDHLSRTGPSLRLQRQCAQAVEYLGRAGRLAAQQTAHSEAVGHLKRALKLLKNVPDSAERGRQEFDLQMALDWSLHILNPAD